MADTISAKADNNVFGNPVTEEVLLGIPEYSNKARKDRSVVAMQWKDKDGKYNEAVSYVRELKRRWGTGVSTLCVVYNGTGEPLKFVTSKDWYGYIYESYPQVIENGQWGGFFHVKTSGTATGSEAAVVYRGKNKDGEETDWMLSWDNPWSGNNHAYAEIHEGGYFDRIDWQKIMNFDRIDWQKIMNNLENSGRQYQAEWKGCITEVEIENDTSPLYTAKLSLA